MVRTCSTASSDRRSGTRYGSPPRPQPAEHIELALCWDKQDANLSRLHWEMMFDGDRFLIFGLTAGATKTDVAITRIVPGTTAEAKVPEPNAARAVRDRPAAHRHDDPARRRRS